MRAAIRRHPRAPRMILSVALQRAILEAGLTMEARRLAIVPYDPEFAAFQARFQQDEIALAFARMQRRQIRNIKR